MAEKRAEDKAVKEKSKWSKVGNCIMDNLEKDNSKRNKESLK